MILKEKLNNFIPNLKVYNLKHPKQPCMIFLFKNILNNKNRFLIYQQLHKEINILKQLLPVKIQLFYRFQLKYFMITWHHLCGNKNQIKLVHLGNFNILILLIIKDWFIWLINYLYWRQKKGIIFINKDKQ